MVKSIEGKHPGYYEAVLQLREITPEIIAFVKKEIDKERIHVAKILHVKNGVDYYLSDNNFTKKLGRKLQEYFGGEYNVTSTLYSRREGRAIYRLTVLFRGMPFKKGDSISYKGEHFYIKSISKEVVLQNAKSGGKIRVKYKDLRLIRPLRISENGIG